MNVGMFVSVFAFSYLFLLNSTRSATPLYVKSKGNITPSFLQNICLSVCWCGFGDLSSSNSSSVLLGFFTTMIEQPSQLYSYTISTSVIKLWMLLALLYNRRKNFELNYHSVVNLYYDFLLLMPSLSCKMLLWMKCYLKSGKCMISSRFIPAMKFETVWRYSFEIIVYKTIYTCPRFSSSVHGT